MTSDYVYCLKQAILDSPDIIYYCLVNPKDFNEQIMPRESAENYIKESGAKSL